MTRHFAEDLPVVCVDREFFTGALVNLFANSLDALPDKGALVVTTCSNTSAVQVSVRDNGIGIAPESLGRIFEPFYSTKTRGTGLGLAICCQIAKAHGGSISVSSSTGGTDFVITLPQASRGGVSNPSKPIGCEPCPEGKEPIQCFCPRI